jgi:hypothetical protein
VNTLEIDGRFGVDPEAVPIANHLRGFGGGQQRLRRHAAGVETFTAHPVALDQRHANAELGGDGSNGQTS